MRRDTRADDSADQLETDCTGFSSLMSRFVPLKQQNTTEHNTNQNKTTDKNEAWNVHVVHF